jgi:hypothetical protein
LDAIELSFTMTEIAYVRIMDYCRAFADGKNTAWQNNAIVLDVWSFIDSAKRLRTVLQNTPGIKKSEILGALLSSTKTVPEFRHYIQHFEEKAATVAPTGHNAWGSFSWVELFPNGVDLNIHAFVPGRLADSTIPVVNPAGRKFHDSIDHFEVYIWDSTLNVSETRRAIQTFSKHFAAAMSAATIKEISGGQIIKVIDIDTASLAFSDVSA